MDSHCHNIVVGGFPFKFPVISLTQGITRPCHAYFDKFIHIVTTRQNSLFLLPRAFSTTHNTTIEYHIPHFYELINPSTSPFCASTSMGG